MEALSQKEQRVYEYIRGVIQENGYAPSVRDIKLALGINLCLSKRKLPLQADLAFFGSPTPS